MRLEGIVIKSGSLDCPGLFFSQRATRSEIDLMEDLMEIGDAKLILCSTRSRLQISLCSQARLSLLLEVEDAITRLPSNPYFLKQQRI